MTTVAWGIHEPGSLAARLGTFPSTDHALLSNRSCARSFRRGFREGSRKIGLLAQPLRPHLRKRLRLQLSSRGRRAEVPPRARRRSSCSSYSAGFIRRSAID